ncbi:phage tail tape measure protein [Paenibacillus larvae]
MGTVGNLNIKVNLDKVNFQKSIEQINREMKLVDAAFKNASSSSKNFGNAQNQLKLKAEQLSNLLGLQKQKVSMLTQSYERARKAQGDNAKETQNYLTQLHNAEARLNKLQGVLDATNKKIADSNGKWAQMREKMQSVGKRMEQLGGQLQSVGSNLSIVFGATFAGSALALKSVVTNAVEFESAFAGVRKTVDASDDEFKKIEKSLFDMSEQMPRSATQLAEIAEAGGQLGVKAKDISSFTKTIAMIADTTNIAQEQASMDFARIANIMELPIPKLENLASSVVWLGNNFATTETEILDFSMRIAGAGRVLDIPAEKIMALSAHFSSFGIRAEAGGTAFSTIMTKISNAAAKNGDELKLWAKIAGMSAAEFKKKFKEDAAGAFADVSNGLGRIKTEGGDLNAVLDDLGIKEALQIDLMKRTAGSGDLLKEALNGASEAFQENAAMQKEASTRYETTKSKLIMMKNTFQNLQTEIGAALLPFVSKLAEAFSTLTKKFQGLSPSMKSFIAVALVVASAILGILAALGAVMFFVGTALSGFGALTKALVSTEKGTKAAGLGLSAMFGPLGLISRALITLLPFIIKFVATNETLKNGFTRAWSAISNAVRPAVEAIGNALNQLEPVFTSILTGLGNALGNVIPVIVDVVSSLSNGIANVFNGMSNVAGGAGSQLSGIFTTIGEVLTTALSAIGVAIQAVMPFFGALVQVGGSILEALSPVFDQFAQMFTELAPEFQKTGQVIGESFSSLGPVFAELGQAFAELFSSIGGLFASELPVILEMASGLFQTFVETAVPAFAEIGKVIAELAATVLPILLAAFTAIFPIIIEVIQSVLPIAIELFQSVITVIAQIAQAVLPVLVQVIQTVFPIVLEVIQAAMAVIIPVIAAIVPVILNITQVVIPIILEVVQAVFPAIMEIIQMVIPIVIEILSGVASLIKNVVVPVIKTILQIVQAVFPAIMQIIKSVIGIITNIIKFFTSILKGDWSGAWEAIKGITDNLLGVIKGIISGAVEAVKGIWKGLKDGVVKLASDMWDGVCKMMESLKDSIVKIWDDVVAFFKKIDLLQIGEDIIKGLIKGVENMAGAVWDAVTGVGESIVNGFKSFLGINSPSRVMAKLATSIPEGVAKGIKSGADAAYKANDELGKKLYDTSKQWMTKRRDLALNKGVMHVQAKLVDPHSIASIVNSNARSIVPNNIRNIRNYNNSTSFQPNVVIQAPDYSQAERRQKRMLTEMALELGMR